MWASWSFIEKADLTAAVELKSLTLPSQDQICYSGPVTADGVKFICQEAALDGVICMNYVILEQNNSVGALALILIEFGSGAFFNR